MSTVTPDAPENEIRRAMADAHRTVATIYDNRDLPLLYWSVEDNGQVHAYPYEAALLDPYADWLDDARRTHNGTESYDAHYLTGFKEGVPVKVTSLIEFTTGPAELPRMIP